MDTILALVIFVLFVLFVIGLFSPSVVTKFFKKAEPNRKNVFLYFGLPMIVVFIIFGVMTDDKSSSSSTSESSTSEAPKTIGTPDQIAFHKALDDFSNKYNDADNEIKKSKVYRELASYLRSYLKGGSFTNWEGTLKSINTTEGGKKLFIEVETEYAGKTITLKTWNNELSDMGSNSMINLNSAVYKQIENLSEGNSIIFSGNFIPDSEKGFQESSMLEQGAVDDPEYIIRFKDIKKK